MDTPAVENKLDSSLAEIELLLSNDAYDAQSAYIAKLRELHKSAAESDQAEFRRLITTDKFLWLGMGTIADLTLSSENKNQRFIGAYYQFANECERLGFGSIYSRDIIEVFGKWVQR